LDSAVFSVSAGLTAKETFFMNSAHRIGFEQK